MVIASRQSRLNTGGMNFMDHSLRITNSAVVGAWRLDLLPTNPVAEELTSALNGTFSNVTWPFAHHSPAGIHAPLFNGSDSTVDLYTAQLNTDMSKTQLSISVWARVANAGVWTDNTKRCIIRIAADSNNYIEIDKATSDDVFQFYYKAGGTTKLFTESTLIPNTNESSVVWSHYCLTVDKTNDSAYAYIDGRQSSELTGLGAWSGVLDSDETLLGSIALASPSSVWSGGISDLIIYSDVLTPDEVWKVSRVR